MQVTLSYDEISQAVEEWVEKHHPYKADPNATGISWDINTEDDDNQYPEGCTLDVGLKDAKKEPEKKPAEKKK